MSQRKKTGSQRFVVVDDVLSFHVPYTRRAAIIGAPLS